MERDFEVYFEIFGKKMKTIVTANNEDEAKEKVKSKIIFHAVSKPKTAYNSVIDVMEDAMNILNKK